MPGQSRNRPQFLKYLLKFFSMMLPMAAVNNLLKYSLKELAMRFRTRLTKHLLKGYLSGFTYYQMSNLDTRISNPDQLLTQDVERFCESVADLYSNISKRECLPHRFHHPFVSRLTRCLLQSAQGIFASSYGPGQPGLAVVMGRATTPNRLVATHLATTTMLPGPTPTSTPQPMLTTTPPHHNPLPPCHGLPALLDITIYTFMLNKAIGPAGPLAMLGYLVVSGSFLTRLRRPVGKFTVMEQHLSGEFRYVNSRLITNSEEVAFYRGNECERATIEGTFTGLMDQLRRATQFRYAMGVVDSIVAKYCATVVGYGVVSRPFLDLSHPRHMKSTQDEIMQDYYRSGRMLVRMSQSVGRIVLAGREVTRLAGFTARVTELQEVLRDLGRGQYERTMLESADSLVPGSGAVEYRDHVIRFSNVPLVTPNGDVLVRNMNFEVNSGMNVLVCGPNGCGKSSLFRILGELWYDSRRLFADPSSMPPLPR